MLRIKNLEILTNNWRLTHPNFLNLSGKSIKPQITNQKSLWNVHSIRSSSITTTDEKGLNTDDLEESGGTMNLLGDLREQWLKAGFGGLAENSKEVPILSSLQTRENRPVFELKPTLKSLSKNKKKKRKHLFVYDDKPKNKEVIEQQIKDQITIQPFDLIPSQNVNFEESEVGKFLSISKEDKEKYFPEGFAGKFGKEGEAIKKQENAGVDLMIRQESLQLLRDIQISAGSNFKSSSHIVLHGQQGSGKSAILNELVYWARKNDFLVVFVKASDFTTGEKIELSFLYDDVYGQQDRALPIIKALLKAHSDKLSKLPLRTEFTLKGFERTEKSTLEDLLKFGANPPNFMGHPVPISSDVLFQFRLELNEVTEYPVLIVADNLNHLYWSGSTFHNPMTENITQPELLSEEDMLLGAAFKNFKNHGLKRGMYIGALTSELPITKFRALFLEQKNNLHALRIPPLRQQEMYNILDYYEKSNYVKQKVPTATRDFLATLLGGRGNELFKYCSTI